MQSAYNQMLALSSCSIGERRWLQISRLTQHVKQCHSDGTEFEMINCGGKEILAFTVNVPAPYWNLWLRIRDAVLKSNKFPLFSSECGWVWIEVWLSVTAFSSFFHTCHSHTLRQKGAEMARTYPAPFINHCQLCHSGLHSQRHVIY